MRCEIVSFRSNCFLDETIGDVISLEEIGSLILDLAGGTGEWRERRDDITGWKDRQGVDVSRELLSSAGLRRWKQDQGHVPDDSHQEKVVGVK